MTSSADRSSSVFASPGRRILNKFTSPFAQKSRSIAEFTVKAHDPHKQYSPGEAVSGAVIVKVVKPTRLTHLSVCLHGFVQVHKTPGSPTEAARGYSSRIGKAPGKKSGEYFGNGFASLFEDESVLCGEGRLAEGSYRFDFAVAFPKDIELPSSIEFERGTISYMVTATLTRPTTMNPTTSHAQRLYLCERIDIANLLPPRPRTITLEPVSRKVRPKNQPKRLTSERLAPSERLSRAGVSPPSVATPLSSSSSRPNVAGLQELSPRSPTTSDLSLDSRVSSNVGRPSVTGTQRTSDSPTRSSAFTPDPSRTITATVESLRGGCLRGDLIPVKISISHTKHVKSINGVIITLYRLARVDLHPALPLGPMSEGQKRQYEDYYPKSLTGLGGLSLSGAGSSHVFRKDLAQTIVPLIIDPQTLQAEIHAKIRIPDDAFPTINTVPGSMISFRYYLEVVLDIQAKLPGNDKFLSQKSPSDESGTAPNGEHGALHDLRGPSILDTAPIRRERSVVTSVFEIVVGTVDSERRKGKAVVRPPPEDENVINTADMARSTTAEPATPQHNTNDPAPVHSQVYPEWNRWDNREDTDWSEYYPDDFTQHHNGQYGYEHADGSQYYDHDGVVQILPPPALEDESGLSEKQRLQRAEARLMPSQPPQPLQNPDVDHAAGPSAPLMPLEEMSHYDYTVPAGPSTQSFASSPTRALPVSFTADPATAMPGPSGAVVSTNLSTAVLTPGSSDDKQELQSQQLQQAASAPPQTDSVEGPASSAEPSAPMLSDDLGEVDNTENLPRYFR